MATNLKAAHAGRYAALARLLVKHRGAAEGPEGGATVEDADELAGELVRMGPTFVKFGQLLSTRADLLPTVYLEALSRLRDDVAPFPADEAIAVVEQELGTKISRAFKSFNRRPLAAASLGQVHKASLRDGRRVAVKVQRPDARQRALEDMEVIAELAGFVDDHSAQAARVGFADMAEEFRQALLDELDYTREAANLRLLAEQLAGFDRIVVPLPVDDHTTARLLTMDLVEGTSVGVAANPANRSGAPSPELAEQLLGAYLDQVLVHGFFHADPHPGNVLLTPDGRVGLIDVGMVARLSPHAQEELLRLLLSVSSRDGRAAADTLEALGTRLDGFDADQLQKRVGDLVLRYGSRSVSDTPVGRLIADLALAASQSGLRPPSELTMLAKTLLNLDEVARVLDPDIRIDEIIERHAARLTRHQMLQAASPAKMMRSTLEAAAFAEALPGRLDKVLGSLAEGRLTFSLEGLDEAALMRGAQKLANRVATGVLIAAFVVAAALFASSGKGDVVGGYPALTWVFLGLAGVAALWLGVSVLRRDLPERRPRP